MAKSAGQKGKDGKCLVIVESPTKARTLRKFLPDGYEVEASMGHVRDLPQSADEIPEKVKKSDWARIGVNCMIFHQVTLAGPVVLGGHVDVCAGAKLLGPLTVGDHAVIGANAVVTRDVPAGATVAGNPARVISGGTTDA